MNIWDKTPELFAALGDEGRMRLACCLLEAGEELCVCEVTDVLEIRQPTASRQLRILKTAGLVRDRREGRWMYYRLSDGGGAVAEAIRATLRATCALSEFAPIRARLRRRLSLRCDGKCVVGAGGLLECAC